VALAIKNTARLDDQAVGVDVSGGYAFIVYLDASLGIDYATKVARDHDLVSLDLSLHAGAFTEN
jgi:hypothetical protein